jgi:dihydroxy-acid dehydratase
MREMLGATSALMGAGLGETCALVTDGRFSDAAHGPAIGYVTPEAARGGVIAVVQDGDRIAIDLAERKLDQYRPALLSPIVRTSTKPICSRSKR